MGMRVSVAVFCGAGLLALLVSCGGGGGAPGGEPGTSTLWIDVGNDASTNGAASDVNAQTLYAGDTAIGDSYRTLLVFDLSSVPNSAVVVGAYLHLTFLTKSGTPESVLDALRFVRYDSVFGVTIQAFSAAELAHDPASNVLVIPQNARPRIGMLQVVTSALNANDALGLRIQFTNPMGGAGVADGIDFASNNHPSEPAAQLEIIYQMP